MVSENNNYVVGKYQNVFLFAPNYLTQVCLYFLPFAALCIFSEYLGITLDRRLFCPMREHYDFS